MIVTRRHKLNKVGLTNLTLPFGANPIAIGYVNKELYLTSLEPEHSHKQESRVFYAHNIGEVANIRLGHKDYPFVGATSYSGVSVFEDRGACRAVPRTSKFMELGVEKRLKSYEENLVLHGAVKFLDLRDNPHNNVRYVGAPEQLPPVSAEYLAVTGKARKRLLEQLHPKHSYNPAMKAEAIVLGDPNNLVGLGLHPLIVNWGVSQGVTSGPDVSVGVVVKHRDGTEEKRIRTALEQELAKAPIPFNKEGRERVEKAVIEALAPAQETAKVEWSKVRVGVNFPHGPQTTFNCRCRAIPVTPTLLSAAQLAIRNLKSIYTEGLKNPNLTASDIAPIYCVIQNLHERVQAEKIKEKSDMQKLVEATAGKSLGSHIHTGPGKAVEEKVHQIAIGQIYNARKGTSLLEGEYRLSGFTVSTGGISLILEGGRNKVTVKGKEALHAHFVFARETDKSPVSNPDDSALHAPPSLELDKLLTIGSRWRGKSTGSVYTVTDLPLERVEVTGPQGGKTLYYRASFNAFFEILTAAEAMQLSMVELNNRFETFIAHRRGSLHPFDVQELRIFSHGQKAIINSYAEAKGKGL